MMSETNLHGGRTGGELRVVATPIGNRGDLSPRAREALMTVDAIACEDTRTLARLFEEGKPAAQLIPYHEHNEAAVAEALATRVERGERVAVVSEAGTPALSDPGFRVVRECHRKGLRVTPIPGPCAAIAALSASGLPSDGFLYLGFLPAKSAARLRVFAEYKDFPYTLIFYESTHRILAFLENLQEVMGPDRTVCVARELTKLYETILTGTVADVSARLKAGSQKGEFVVLVAKQGYVV